MAKLLQLAKQLRRDRRGASIIEMALALPILAVMLVGLVDVASVYSAQMSIQQAAARALERLQVNGFTNSFAFLKAEAAAAAGVPASQVTVTTWLECNNVKVTATTCSGTQVAGKYVEVKVDSTYTPFFRFSPLGARNAQGNVVLSATSSVRYG